MWRADFVEWIDSDGLNRYFMGVVFFSNRASGRFIGCSFVLDLLLDYRFQRIIGVCVCYCFPCALKGVLGTLRVEVEERD